MEPDYPMWFDREGEPITAGMWEMYRGLPDYYRVSYDVVGNVVISTVWLGIDHGLGSLRGGRPIIFETMIFGGPMDQECWRYYTEAEAKAGHAEVVSLLRTEQEVTTE